MDPDAMTTLLGDAIFNIEVEEYWEAHQHALKNPYEARTDDENDEGGEAPSDDEGSDSEDDNSGDNNSDDSEDSDGGDNSSDDSDSEGSNSEDYDSQDSGNDSGEPLSDRKDEDAGAFYDDNFDDVDYNNEDTEDDAKGVDGDYNESPYRQLSDWSCIIDASLKSGP